MPDKLIMPYGVYDTKQCGLLYIGLHDGEDDVWRIYLGWPETE